MQPIPQDRRRWLALAWALVVPLALGFAWEHLAQGFGADVRGLDRRGDVFVRAGQSPAKTRLELPPPQAPRVAIFGSSQIATVKDGGLALSERLHPLLVEAGTPNEVVDFSTGGQQTVESLAILFSTLDTARPSLVVIGVSLFSMLSVDVRETLLDGLDADVLQQQILVHVPRDASRSSVRSLVSFAGKPNRRIVSRGETLQQRVDRAVGAQLSTWFAFVENRQVLFDELIDRPIRRDLRAWLMRNIRAGQTARSYEPNAAYPVSVLGLETMQALCEANGIPMLVVLLPFDATRPPVPFPDETQARVNGDLSEAAAGSGFTLVDLSRILPTEFFGDYIDGSPDNLHFREGGHGLVASALAPRVARLLDEASAEAAAAH